MESRLLDRFRCVQRGGGDGLFLECSGLLKTVKIKGGGGFILKLGVEKTRTLPAEVTY